MFVNHFFPLKLVKFVFAIMCEKKMSKLPYKSPYEAASVAVMSRKLTTVTEEAFVHCMKTYLRSSTMIIAIRSSSDM